MHIFFHNQAFQKIIGINVISTIGDALYYIALMTYASHLPQANVAIAIVAVSESLPMLAALLLGSLADASRQRSRCLISNAVIRSLCYLLIGVVVGFDPSLLILIGIAFINLFSDLIGNYSSSLMTPFLPLLIKPAELEEAQGLNGSLAQTIRIAANFIGSFLIGVLSFQQLAWINSLTFLLTVPLLLLLKPILQPLEDQHLKTAALSPAGLLQQIKTALNEIYRNHQLLQLLLVFTVINALFTTIMPLLSMLITQQPTMIIKNFAFTLALIQGIVACGAIIGGLTGSRIFKSSSLYQLNPWIVLTSNVLLFSMLIQQIWLLLPVFGLLGFLIGAANPKLSAAVLTLIPLEQLGTVSGGMNTLLLSLPPVFILLFSSLATIFSLQVALIILGVIACGLWFVTFNLRKTNF